MNRRSAGAQPLARPFLFRHAVRVGRAGSREPGRHGKELASRSSKEETGWMEMGMRFLGRMLLTLGLFAAPTALHAQGSWPERPITLIVPYAAGGYTDLVGRLTARYLEK